MAKPIDTTDTTEPKHRIPHWARELFPLAVILVSLTALTVWLNPDPPPDFAERARRVAGCVLHMENAVPVELTERQHAVLVNHCQEMLSHSLDW